MQLSHERSEATGKTFPIDLLCQFCQGSKAYAFLNDDRPVPPAVIDALRRYDVTPLLWSKREEAKEELAA